MSVLVGRHGAMNPAGRVRIRNIMPTVRDYPLNRHDDFLSGRIRQEVLNDAIERGAFRA